MKKPDRWGRSVQWRRETLSRSSTTTLSGARPMDARRLPSAYVRPRFGPWISTRQAVLAPLPRTGLPEDARVLVIVGARLVKTTPSLAAQAYPCQPLFGSFMTLTPGQGEVT